MKLDETQSFDFLSINYTWILIDLNIFVHVHQEITLKCKTHVLYRFIIERVMSFKSLFLPIKTRKTALRKSKCCIKWVKTQFRLRSLPTQLWGRPLTWQLSTKQSLKVAFMESKVEGKNPVHKQQVMNV